MNGLVSIIMPTYNSKKFLLESIDSVLNQDYTSWELIIVDDCSSDSSYDIAQEFSQIDSRIRSLRLDKNSGAAAARNLGISESNGRFIAFLDSDDVWLPDKLRKQIFFMVENDVCFSFSAYEKMGVDGEFLGSIGVSCKESYRSLLKTCSIGCLTAIYDTERIGKMYMRLDTKREDYALWLDILKKTEFAYGINECLAKYRVYSSQNSANKLKMARENWVLYRKIEKLGFFYTLYVFGNYALRGYLRLKAPLLARVLGFLN